MACDTKLKPQQTISQRADEIRTVVARLAEALTAGKVRAVVSATGAIAFAGLSEADRDGVTDACAFRRIMATGSASAKLAIQKAEMLAGRSVNRQALAHGHHSHDGGHTWHHGH